jgi:hypothetical protein
MKTNFRANILRGAVFLCKIGLKSLFIKSLLFYLATLFSTGFKEQASALAVCFGPCLSTAAAAVLVVKNRLKKNFFFGERGRGSRS